MSQATLALAKRVVDEVLNQGKAAAIDELFDAKMKGLVTGGIKDRKTSFPDLKYTIQSVMDQGDQVAFRYTATGTHKGAFRDIAATNKAVSWEGSAVFTFKADKIVDIDVREDQSSKMIQLGRIPALRVKFVPNATGVWTSSQSGVIVTLGLKQTGAKVEGTVAVSGIPGESKLEGAVEGTSITFSGAIGTNAFRFAGKFQSQNRIDGELSGAFKAPATLLRS